jgi:hypothetical protein
LTVALTEILAVSLVLVLVLVELIEILSSDSMLTGLLLRATSELPAIGVDRNTGSSFLSAISHPLRLKRTARQTSKFLAIEIDFI